MELFKDKYKAMYGAPEPRFPGEKPREYYIQKMQYYYSHLMHESGSLSFAANSFGSNKRDFKTLRDYGRGIQDINKYLEEIGYTTEEAQKIQTNNVSYAPIPIWPKFRNLILSKFADLQLTPNPRAENSQASFEREFLKNKMKLLRQSETRTAVPDGSLPNDQFSDLKTPDDVDFIFQIGGIKLPIEIGLKDDIDKTMKASGFETLTRMGIEDIIDLGGIAMDTVLTNGQIKLDYIDFPRVIIRPSIYPDFRDSDVRGYLAEKKVSELIMIDRQAVEANWSFLEKSYRNVGSFASYIYNQGRGYRSDYVHRGEGNNPVGMDFGTTIVKLYWLDTEMKTYVSGTRSRGGMQYEEVGPDFRLSERAIRGGRKLESIPIQRMYKCSMVLGTEIILDYGPADSIVPPGEIGAKSLVWPLHVSAAQEPSITEKVIPFLDDIQISILKRRDLISKLPPGPRMLIFKSMIKDGVTLGGKKYTFKDILKMYQREGIMVLDEADEYNLPGEDVNHRKDPIRFIPSGIAEDLELLEANISMSIDKIRQISGVNEVTDGTSGNSDMLKSMVSSLQSAANNALRPWVDMYVSFYKNVAESLMWTYQLYRGAGILDNNDNWGPYGQLFRNFGPELLRYDMGLTISVDERSYFEFLMQDLLNKREILPPETYFTVFNSLNQGDLKKAEYFLIKGSKEAGEIAHQRQMEIAQATAQANRAAAIAAEQERRQTLGAELETSIALMRNKADIDSILADLQLNRDKDFERLKAALQKDTAVAVVSENNENRLNQN